MIFIYYMTIEIKIIGKRKLTNLHFIYKNNKRLFILLKYEAFD